MNNPNWHDDVYFGIHYDFHANETDTQLGSELTHEHLRERLLLIKPDWIHCDCKGHRGYTSWPTQTGSTSPGVVRDSLRIHRDVTRELGIKLGVHYSGVWDNRAIELHPDWARIDETGNRDPRITCRHSAYLDELMIPQLLELIDRYDVDGFWVDGENWASLPCWCQRCRDDFTRRTGLENAPLASSDPNWQSWLSYHRGLFCDHVTKYANAVHARKPACLVCSSYMYGARQPDPQMTGPIDYLSGDLDFRWGSHHAMLEARVFDSRRKTWDLMAWMHTKPGEMGDKRPWILKPLVHLCQELSEVIAHGGAAMVYENPQRTGHLTGWHHQRIADLAAFLRARKPYCFQTETVPQAAILHYADHFYRHNNILYQYEPACDPIEGALQSLLEIHIPTGILTEDAITTDLARYPLAILPETTGLTEDQIQHLAGYVTGGGHLLVAGVPYPQLTGARPHGPAVESGHFLPAGSEIVPVHGSWQPVTCDPSTEPIAHRYRQQEPSKDQTSDVVVTQRTLGKGSVIAVHGPVFSNYVHWPHPQLRTFIRNIIARYDIPWRVTTDAPARLEIVLRQRAGSLLINLINRPPVIALPPRRILIEELPPLTDITLNVKLPAAPQSVALHPTGSAIAHHFSSGILTIHIPRVDIHEILEIRL